MNIELLNLVANEYGYNVNDDGVIRIINNNKNTGVVVKLVRKKLNIVTECGKVLFTGANKPQALENFLKSYWYATKI